MPATTYSFYHHLHLMAYGIKVSDIKDYRSPLEFTSVESWLGKDFEFFLENLFDEVLEDIASDLQTVWSTNLSE